ncbi:FUSC family protein [Dactylosporangium sp. CS-033363]|uniref:FUSC family protein n=1 Tax=Dactylosporangium sp. CS-033363 TaxID=3239935 RepID=UPI003D8E9DD8
MSFEAGRVRLRQLEIIAVIAGQCGLAAAISWEVAHRLFDVAAPVFAPTAAVGTIVAALGQRARRTVELLVGVAGGVLLSDALLWLIGFGPWQTGLVVALAVGLSLFAVGSSSALVAQAGSTAVLIATLWPAQPSVQWVRIEEAAVGGVVGLLVVALLLPVNPMRVLDRAAAPLVETVAGELDNVARALAERDADLAARALDRLRATEPDLARVHEAMHGAEEVVTIAPARWARRGDVERYRQAVDHVDVIVLECRELARWATDGLRRGEPLPEPLLGAVAGLAVTIRGARRAGRRGEQLGAAREAALEVARLAGQATHWGLGQYGEGMVTQLLTLSSDLIQATGERWEKADRMVRHAAR